MLSMLSVVSSALSTQQAQPKIKVKVDNKKFDDDDCSTATLTFTNLNGHSLCIDKTINRRCGNILNSLNFYSDSDNHPILTTYEEHDLLSVDKMTNYSRFSDDGYDISIYTQEKNQCKDGKLQLYSMYSIYKNKKEDKKTTSIHIDVVGETEEYNYKKVSCRLVSHDDPMECVFVV